jgi:hypothetical protein
VRWVVAVVLLAACAVGRVRPDGTLEGIALGQSRIERCELEPQADRPCHCDAIAGGALSQGFVATASVLVTIVTSLITAGVL